jgi:hypothetical protein
MDRRGTQPASQRVSPGATRQGTGFHAPAKAVGYLVEV